MILTMVKVITISGSRRLTLEYCANCVEKDTAGAELRMFPDKVMFLQNWAEHWLTGRGLAGLRLVEEGKEREEVQNPTNTGSGSSCMPQSSSTRC